MHTNIHDDIRIGTEAELKLNLRSSLFLYILELAFEHYSLHPCVFYLRSKSLLRNNRNESTTNHIVEGKFIVIEY